MGRLINIFNKTSIKDISIFFLMLTSICFYDYKVLFLGSQALAFFVICFSSIRLTKDTVHLLVWCIVFTAFALLSYFWAINKSTVLSTTLSFIQVCLIVFCIVQYADNSVKLKKVVVFFIISCLILSIRFFIDVPYTLWGNQTRFSRKTIFGGNGPAVSLSFCSTILIWCVFKMKLSRKWKTLLILLICVFMSIAFLMGTRKSIVVLLCGIILTLFLEEKNWKKRIVSLLVIIISLVSVYLLITKIPVFYYSIGYRMKSAIEGVLTGEGDSSYNSRYLFIKDALSVFAEHPLIGVGQDCYRYVNNIEYEMYAHNNYAELLANLGIIGFIVFYAFHFYLVKNSLRNRKKTTLPLLLEIIILILDFTMVSYSDECIYIILSLILIMNSNKGDLQCRVDIA